MDNFGIISLYCGKSGKRGYYNNQEIGLAKALCEHNFKCYVFMPNIVDNQILEENIDDKIMVIHFPSKHIGVHSIFNCEFLLKYNLKYLQINGDNQIYVKHLANFCDKHNISKYFYIGSLGTDSKNKLKKLVMNTFVSSNIEVYKKGLCFAKTEFVKRELARRSVVNAIVAPVGLDTSDICKANITRDDLNLPHDKKILLFIGRMEEYKKPYLMIDIMEKLSDDYYCVMIGNGSLDRTVDKLIEERCLTRKILRIKEVKNKEIHNYYYVCDYFINLNEKEIFGMSILEAMYQGCNVIAINAPGPNQIIKNNETGFLVKNINQIVNIVNEDKKLCKDFITKTITDNFTWEKTALIILNNIL